MDEDERFTHIKNDPRFRSIPKREKKIQIDKRFTTMFHNKGFQLNYFMDKRGRPVQQSMSEDLRKYYEVDSEPSDNENHGGHKTNKVSKKVKRKLNKYEEKKEDVDSGRDSSLDERGDGDQPQGDQFLIKKGTKTKKKPGTKEHAQKARSSDDEDQEENHDEKDINKDGDNDEEQEDIANKDNDSDVSSEGGDSEPDLARGEGNLESSSSDESSDGDEEEEEEETGFDHQWGETDKTVTRSEDVSCRLALCNMDWDRIKAEDLYVLFNNFKPPQGIIHSIKIYPSEYGIKRMREEELHGPKELTSRKEEEMETHDGSKYHMESLRQYQLNRLRYYYAVIDCDSVETASTLYNELDGREYESSASQLDLRYIPDSMVFFQEPRNVADKLPDMSVYTPVLFTTKALQQTMVELTWDETNPNRLRTLEKAFYDEADNLNADLRAYLASSSSSSSEDETQDTHDKDKDEDLLEPVKEKPSATDRISKYKELLASMEEDENKKKEKDIEMEITWEPGLKDRTENLIKMKQQKQEMSYFEKYLEKKKEAKKQRRKDKKEATEGNDSDDLCDDDDVPSDVDVNDSFFQDEINSMKAKKTSKKNKIRNTSKTEEGQDVKSKAELELLLMDEGEDGRKHFNLKNLMEEETLSKRKRKKLERTRLKEQKSKTEDDFKINAEDPRFSALFQSADYNIDPSDTHFKKTKAMESLLQEKQKRRAEKRFQVSKDVNTNEDSSKRRMDPSLSYLVKSVKNKAQNFKRRKN